MATMGLFTLGCPVCALFHNRSVRRQRWNNSGRKFNLLRLQWTSSFSGNFSLVCSILPTLKLPIIQVTLRMLPSFPNKIDAHHATLLFLQLTVQPLVQLPHSFGRHSAAASSVALPKWFLDDGSVDGQKPAAALATFERAGVETELSRVHATRAPAAQSPEDDEVLLANRCWHHWEGVPGVAD